MSNNTSPNPYDGPFPPIEKRVKIQKQPKRPKAQNSKQMLSKWPPLAPTIERYGKDSGIKW